jgi:hypothetical protein
MPTPAELLAADPQVLRDSGLLGAQGRDACGHSRSGSSTDA